MALTRRGEYKEIMRDIAKGEYVSNRDARLIKLLDQGVNPNMTEKELGDKSPFFVMVDRFYYYDSERILRRMIKGGLDLNVKTNDGRTPLHCAVAGNLGGLVQEMIDAGADVEARDNQNRTPFILALIKRNFDSAEQLMTDDSVDETWKDESGRTLLSCAVGAHLEILRRLIKQSVESGVDVNVRCNRYGYTALHYAAQAPAQNLDALLAVRGIDVNIKDFNGATPLHRALQRKRDVRNAHLLLKAGARVGPFEECILVTAMRGGADLSLLRSIVDVAEQQKIILDVNAALVEGVKNRCDPDKIHFLIGLGADANTVQGDGAVTPLLAAGKSGKMELVKVLLEVGADINAVSPLSGMTPLMAAAEQGDAAIVRVMLAAGADITTKDYSDKNACDYCKGADVRSLIQAEMDRINPPPPKPPEVPRPAVEGKCDSYSQSVTYRIDDGLTCTFNFFTRQVIYRDGTSMCIKGFSEIERPEAIEEAHAVLKETLGEKALPLAPPSVAIRKKMKLREPV
ncbi:MAG: ankyrin repeat domain-containing protein [Alphaproteobacteria bacterium]|nr:ankyrin repeat domain-containing protein [Alphaproteobacteria bacterium]